MWVETGPLGKLRDGCLIYLIFSLHVLTFNVNTSFNPLNLTHSFKALSFGKFILFSISITTMHKFKFLGKGSAGLWVVTPLVQKKTRRFKKILPLFSRSKSKPSE
jgi:hypothetical protein